jgi:hypothetical protein
MYNTQRQSSFGKVGVNHFMTVLNRPLICNQVRNFFSVINLERCGILYLQDKQRVDNKNSSAIIRRKEKQNNKVTQTERKNIWR